MGTPDGQPVTTVTGPVETADLGTVLAHEHVFTNLMREYRGDGLLNEPELAAAELSDLRLVVNGPATIMDCTTMEFGRDPQALAAASLASGVNIVMGTGNYRDPYLDREFIDSHDIDEHAERIVHDLKHGAEGTDIKAGFIGEVGADKWYVSAAEERCFRAAARAQLRTGALIVTHAARWPVGRDQLKILSHEGVSPNRIAIGHCDFVFDRGYHREMAEAGCYLGFEVVSRTTEHDLTSITDNIAALVEAGHAGQILLGHDVHLRSHLRRQGGDGYTYIPTEFADRLRRRGLPSDIVTGFLTANPTRALTGA